MKAVYPSKVGLRVQVIGHPERCGVIVRSRKAARRTFHHVDVRLDDGNTVPSISSCWDQAMSATISQPTNAALVPIRVNGRMREDGSAYLIQAYVERYPGRVWWTGPRTGGSRRVYGAKEEGGLVYVQVLRFGRGTLLADFPEERDLQWQEYQPEAGELVYAQ